jgi:hypothetical protein
MNRKKHPKCVHRAYFHARGVHITKNFRGYSSKQVYTYKTLDGDLAFTEKPKQKGSWAMPLGDARMWQKIWRICLGIKKWRAET